MLYVFELNKDQQKQIKKEIKYKLKILNCYNYDNYERAINSKVADLSDLIDIKKYIK